jgi:hypothetical protein
VWASKGASPRWRSPGLSHYFESSSDSRTVGLERPLSGASFCAVHGRSWPAGADQRPSSEMALSTPFRDSALSPDRAVRSRVSRHWAGCSRTWRRQTVQARRAPSSSPSTMRAFMMLLWAPIIRLQLHRGTEQRERFERRVRSVLQREAPGIEDRGSFGRFRARDCRRAKRKRLLIASDFGHLWDKHAGSVPMLPRNGGFGTAI